MASGVHNFSGLVNSEKCKIRGISSEKLDQLAQIRHCRISTGTAWRGANQFDNVQPHHRYRLTLTKVRILSRFH